VLDEPPTGHDAQSIERSGTRLLGRLSVLRDAGVVHVTAVHDSPGALTTMRIGPSTPRSDHDFFVLCLVRAHADAIVSTLKNLRDEPQLRFELLGDGTLPAALHAYRRETLDRDGPPRLLLLTRDGDVDLGHPALHGWARPTLVMPIAAAPSMERRLRDAGLRSEVDVWARRDSSMRATVDELRARPEIRTVSIEAGPSTTRALYRDPCAIDALVLSRFEGPSLPAEVVGGELVTTTSLESLLPVSGGRHAVTEPSGPWSFELRHR